MGRLQRKLNPRNCDSACLEAITIPCRRGLLLRARSGEPMPPSELERDLERLESLHRDGVLTDAEYEAARKRAIDNADLGLAEEPPHTPGNALGWFRATFWGSWWRKTATVVGGFIFAMIVIGLAVPSSPDDDTPSAAAPTRTVEATSTTEPTPEPTAEQTPESTPTREAGLSAPVEIGNLELTVLAVEAYDSSLDEPNYRVKVRLRKLRGSEYDFTGSTFQVVDAQGNAHDHATSCTGCPQNIIPDGVGFVLTGDDTSEKWVYFDIQGTSAPRQLKFKSSSILGSEESIDLPSSPRPTVRERRDVSTPTPTTEVCPTASESVWAAQVALALEPLPETATALGELFALAGEVPAIMFTDDWQIEVALNLVVLSLAADELEAVSAPSSRTREIQATVDQIARETRNAVDNLAYGIDNLDPDSLARGADGIGRAGDLLTVVGFQIDGMCG